MKMRVTLSEKLNYIKGQKNKTKGGEMEVSISLFLLYGSAFIKLYTILA
jgi:hypothetical protein